MIISCVSQPQILLKIPTLSWSVLFRARKLYAWRYNLSRQWFHYSHRALQMRATHLPQSTLAHRTNTSSAFITTTAFVPIATSRMRRYTICTLMYSATRTSCQFRISIFLNKKLKNNWRCVKWSVCRSWWQCVVLIHVHIRRLVCT